MQKRSLPIFLDASTVVNPHNGLDALITSISNILSIFGPTWYNAKWVGRLFGEICLIQCFAELI